MICAWNAFLKVLPVWIRQEVDLQGKDSLMELRLRINAPPELVHAKTITWINRKVTQEDISFCINIASQYSPWASTTISKGYITITGGHRIGICGEVVCKHRTVADIKNVRSICIRIARDFMGVSQGINIEKRSILILGAPGWGKTTLLRDLIRRIGSSESVSVVDERGELFPHMMATGKRVDILTGCPKAVGINLVLRTMGPSRIAIDEITCFEDAHAIIQSVGCGVGFLATAHASSFSDFLSRPIYCQIWETHLFDSIVVMHPDKTFHEEEVKQ